MARFPPAVLDSGRDWAVSVCSVFLETDAFFLKSSGLHSNIKVIKQIALQSYNSGSSLGKGWRAEKWEIENH